MENTHHHHHRRHHRHKHKHHSKTAKILFNVVVGVFAVIAIFTLYYLVKKMDDGTVEVNNYINLLENFFN